MNSTSWLRLAMGASSSKFRSSEYVRTENRPLFLNRFNSRALTARFKANKSYFQDPNAAMAAMAGYDYYPPETPPAVAMTQLTHAPHHNLPIMAATQQPAVPLYDPNFQQQQQQGSGYLFERNILIE